jgi:hypothetical protein
MLFLKKHLLFALSFLVFYQFPITVYSQSNTVDSVLKQADLPKLIGTNQAVNLAAQPMDPKGSSKDVNSFNDFIAIGVVSTPTMHTNMTNFNQQQIILKKVTRNEPWIGVAQYLQKDIPNLSLQDGLVAVQACMKKKGKPAPSQDVAHVTIYKTLNTAQFVYDYAFKMPGKTTSCQEILYTPVTQDCEMGMQTDCHIHIEALSMPSKIPHI